MFRTCSNNLFRSLPAVGIYSNNAWSQKKEDAPVTRIGPPPVSIPSFSPARVSYPPKLSPPSLLSNISYPKDSPLKQSQLIQKIQQIQKECLNPPEIKTPLSAAPSIEVSTEKEIPEAAPIVSDIVGNPLEKRADATDENAAADPKPSEDVSTAEVACLEKESPPIERSAHAKLPQEASLGQSFPSRSFFSNVAYAEPLPQEETPLSQKIPKGLSAEQNRLIQKIRKGRLDSPTEEIARLIKEGFLSEEEEIKLNETFNSNQEVPKALYAGALAIRKVLETTHYVFLHGQAQIWIIYADVMKEMVKRRMPELDVGQYKFLRPLELFNKKEYIKIYKNLNTSDIAYKTQTDLLSVDGYFYNTSEAESCHSFLTNNTNIWKSGSPIRTSEALHEFYPNIPTEFFKKTIINQLNIQSLEKASCGNIIIIAVPKSLESAYYRSHSYGKICKCHPEEEDIQILESLQKNKLSSETECEESLHTSALCTTPQYRLYLPKIGPESGCRIYVLSPDKAARKELKHEIRKMLNSFNSPEKIYDLVLAAVTQDPSLLCCADDSFKKNEKIVVAAVTKDGRSIEFADPSLKKNLGIARIAVKQDQMAFKLIDPSLKENEELIGIVVEAILPFIIKDGMAIEFADPSLKKNLKIARAAVTQNPLAFQFIDPSLKENKELIDIALKSIFPFITKDPQLLHKLGGAFKKNKEVVRTAVTQDGMALEFADDSLKKDLEIARAAVRQNRGALQFVDSSIQMTLAFELGFGV